MTVTLEKRISGSMLVYGDTQKYLFPLILFMGPEYTSYPSAINGPVTSYELTDAGSRFWSRAFSLVKRVSGNDIRRDSILNKCSPIAFSHVLPLCLSPRISRNERKRMRASISADEIVGHLGTVFAEPIFSRVKLVLLSGLDGRRGLAAPARIAKEMITEHSLPHLEIPHLASRVSNQALEAPVREDQRRVIIEIMEEFKGCIRRVRPWHWTNWDLYRRRMKFPHPYPSLNPAPVF